MTYFLLFFARSQKIFYTPNNEKRIYENERRGEKVEEKEKRWNYIFFRKKVIIRPTHVIRRACGDTASPTLRHIHKRIS